MESKTAKVFTRDVLKKEFGFKESPYQYGVYCYMRKSDGVIVYIGKCSNIWKGERAYQHMVPSKTDLTMINKALKDNPENYNYMVISLCADWWILENQERQLIQLFKPIYNTHHNTKNKGK